MYLSIISKLIFQRYHLSVIIPFYLIRSSIKSYRMRSTGIIIMMLPFIEINYTIPKNIYPPVIKRGKLGNPGEIEVSRGKSPILPYRTK